MISHFLVSRSDPVGGSVSRSDPVGGSVSWLHAKHADEVVSIIPSNSSYVVCVGDLTNAIAVLNDYVTCPTNDVESGIYFSRASLLSTYNDPSNATAIAAIQGHLDDAAQTLSTELGVTIIRIPVAYTLEYTGEGVCKTFLPSSVNAAVANVGGTVKIGIPNPRFAPFRTVIYSRLTFLGANAKWIYADTPHLLGGAAHCSSNTDKIPPSTP